MSSHIHRKYLLKKCCPTSCDTQSHRPNRYETDTKPTTIIKLTYKLVWIRYWFSASKNCWLPVRYMLVWCRFCQETFVDVSVFIRPPMAHGLLVYIGHALSICRLTCHSFKTNSKPNQVRHNSKLWWVGQHSPYSRPSPTWHIRNPNLMQSDNRMWRHRYILRHAKKISYTISISINFHGSACRDRWFQWKFNIPALISIINQPTNEPRIFSQVLSTMCLPAPLCRQNFSTNSADISTQKWHHRVILASFQ